jgi:hypothetical protein
MVSRHFLSKACLERREQKHQSCRIVRNQDVLDCNDWSLACNIFNEVWFDSELEEAQTMASVGTRR